MKNEKVFADIAESARSGGEYIAHSFLENYQDIEQYISTSGFQKSFIRTHDLSIASKSIAFSCLFNDVTILTLNLGTISSTILDSTGFQKYFNFKYPRFLISEKKLYSQPLFDIQNSEAFPSFCGRSDEEANRFYYSLYDLIESGKVIPLPARTLIFMSKNSTHIFEIDIDSPQEEWRIGLHKSRFAHELKLDSLSQPKAKEIFNITIPYIENINFSDLNKIIDDERDQIKDLKIALKNAINTAERDCLHTDEIVSDIVEPELRTLERKFKRIANFDSLKRNGAVLTAGGIALCSYLNQDISQAVYNLLTTGSLSAGLYFHIEKQKNLEELKDNPFYFFWKCKNM